MSNGNKDQLLKEATERASTDLAFRKQLLANPESAIFATFGIRIPAGLRIRFVEKPADLDALVVLPEMVSPVGELDDDDLRAVAGGTDGDPNEW